MDEVEILAIILSIGVIIIEIVILYKLSEHKQEMNRHLNEEIKNLDKHTSKLEGYIKDMDAHTRKTEETMKRLLKETEEIYDRVCRPLNKK